MGRRKRKKQVRFTIMVIKIDEAYQFFLSSEIYMFLFEEEEKQFSRKTENGI